MQSAFSTMANEVQANGVESDIGASLFASAMEELGPASERDIIAFFKQFVMWKKKHTAVCRSQIFVIMFMLLVVLEWFLILLVTQLLLSMRRVV